MFEDKLEKYSFVKIDNSKDESFLREVANVLSDSFNGIQVGSQFIQEPMVNALKLGRESFADFNLEFLKANLDSGLSFAAIDKETGKVVGAISCENFDVNAEGEAFTGDLSNLNDIVEVLVELDIDFVKSIEAEGSKVGLGDLSHAFIIGVVTEFDKKYIGGELTRLWIEESRKRGYKKVFVEATNIRSQALVKDFFDFKVAELDGEKIEHVYATSKLFGSIPEDIAISCELLYLDL